MESNERDIVLNFVRADGNNLRYASEKMKDDKEIVLTAVKNDGRTLYYAGEKLQAEFKEKGIEEIEREVNGMTTIKTDGKCYSKIKQTPKSIELTVGRVEKD